jgi:1-deoxy-D-xylulose-5-phosphate reductoisomerase
MMNKGLEVIEACLLFGVAPDDVRVVIHRQSVIHSLVDYIDGSVLAQLGNPDMRIPIAHALAWPERFDSGAEPLDLFKVQTLEFAPPDLQRFPCLDLAYAAVRQGGTMPAILNAANEVAVASFLDGRLRFTSIADTIRQCMDTIPNSSVTSIECVLEADRQARDAASRYADRVASG